MRSHTGASLLSSLIALAIIAVLVPSVRAISAGHALSAARGLAGSVSAARARAVAAGLPVGVVTSGTICSLASSVVRLDHQQAGMVARPPRGLMFTPDGLPRTCDGGGVGNTTILLEHRGRQAAVIVSSLGRVRWEPR